MTSSLFNIAQVHCIKYLLFSLKHGISEGTMLSQVSGKSKQWTEESWQTILRFLLIYMCYHYPYHHRRHRSWCCCCWRWRRRHLSLSLSLSVYLYWRDCKPLKSIPDCIAHTMQCTLGSIQHGGRLTQKNVLVSFIIIGLLIKEITLLLEKNFYHMKSDWQGWRCLWWTVFCFIISESW